MQETPEAKNCRPASRWISLPDLHVWQSREWGWKFIGVAKSGNWRDIFSLVSTDCDHPYDIFNDEEV